MATRFKLVKRAGDPPVTEEALSPLAKALMYALGGAAIGGVGTNLVSRSRQIDEETEEERDRRIRDATILGAVMGGGAGGSFPLASEFLRSGPRDSGEPGSSGLGGLFGGAIGMIGAGLKNKGVSAFPSPRNILREIAKFDPTGATGEHVDAKKFYDTRATKPTFWERNKPTWQGAKYVAGHSPLKRTIPWTLAAYLAGRFFEDRLTGSP